MGHLYSVRTGWEAERLAHYLLSRFSFVAQPTTIADDVGSDFYCTIFDIVDSKPPTVEPRTSFAIQVKSNAEKIEAHNKVRYLHHLEIPFFLGVVDQTAAELKIYSAERFPMMTAVFGLPEKLWLQPVVDDNHAWEGTDAKSGVTLNCYHVCTFFASEGRNEIRPKVAQLLKLCRRAVANIGTRRAEEHIYQIDDEGKRFSIVAGCGSVNCFRDNIYRRLAEAFFNFEYMLNRDPALFDLAEFQVYEAFHLALVSAHPRESLDLAHGRYRQVKSIVEQRYPKTTP
jgi:ligand-binding SRPBCC domain-containing protein